MSYLALNKNQLSRFSHHWFWGLGVDILNSNTLSTAVESLQDNPSELKRLEKQILGISQKSWLVRGLYWIFNLDDYRLHYYQLHAYRSWELFKKGSTMLSSIESFGTNAPTVFIVSGVTLLGVALSPILIRSFAWFSQRMQSYFSNIPELEAVDSKLSLVLQEQRQSDETVTEYAPEPESFSVTSEMQASLETLGLNKNIGDIVLFDELKKAYLKRCRETHPDKTHRDTVAEFRVVSEAYQALISIVEKEASNSLSCDESGLSLIKKMNELREEMQKESMLWRDIGTIVDQQNEQISEQNERIKGLYERISEQNERMRDIDERINEQKERMREQKERISKHKEQHEKQLGAIGELMADYAEMNRRVKRLISSPESVGSETGVLSHAAGATNPQGFFSEGACQRPVDGLTASPQLH